MSSSSGSYYPTDPTTGTMTGASAASSTGGPSGTKDVAKDQAAHVGQEAKESGQHVAGVAKEQAAGVVGEARRQAKDLLHQGRGQLSEQAGAQQQKAATGLRSLSDELRGMVEGQGGSGMAADLVHEVSQRVSSAADWLEQRDPATLLQEVQGFARRRPGAFLAIAAGLGVVAGRITRGMADNAKQEHQGSGTGSVGARGSVDLPATPVADYPAGSTYETGAYQTGTAYPTGTTYPTGTSAYGTEPLSDTDADDLDIIGRRGQVAP